MPTRTPRPLVLHTAAPLTGTRPLVTPLTIVLNAPIPEAQSLAEAKACYEAEAQALAEALCETLPQGTLERLVVALMERTASYYRGRLGTG